MAEGKSTVIIRRVKKVQGGGHHGGAWKVAFADFVTAMMAFFLVLWLMAATTKEQRAAISEYFRNPSPLSGKSPAPSPGMNGPGGASTSMIKLGGTADMAKGQKDEMGRKRDNAADTDVDSRAKDKKRLEALMQDLKEAIDKSQALEPFKDQLLLDLTPDGLRIQIVDKQNRPMFDIGRDQLKPYTVDILRELSSFINQVPNHISITGHTDTTAYSSDAGYTNWELSADRANAARRALVGGGMADAKVTRVVGLSSSVLFDKTNPQNPINRRISIVVMTQDAEQAALAGSDQGVALGKPIPDADTHVPDLSGAAATGTATVGTPAAAGSSTMAPAPAAAGTATPVPAPAAAGTKPAPPRVSSSAQVASAAALAKAAEAAIAAPRVATSESAQPN
ncbi:flagellar motor protein MotB [Xanthomonas campestris pv. campestris]|uniref:Chemotaxis MotB protein n=5 Tax=Xanthomonas campestris TaxID=339 RepID=Q8P4Q3_XANCP|nr:flagellar motor protein MotB [Xanthomonas campestris]AAM42924.1 chemotaxis MotB protein [Xanthomonas campestris pv. campestris str. ATCC 33913]AAY50765.1 chemotaxis MotB protein [Xanthomonas campestris pv. campestris str. 8004]AKS17598.1 flagellar motor protein MotB [Xanthomonas campestris pv. campestris]MBD8248362.1 flagellar motor protein MotB [Xanthomonas campestris]MCC5045325.1 flagellar motor protein MotB [Xanthomonas campestris]